MKYTCSMETVQQNGRFTLFSIKFLSIYSILYGYIYLLVCRLIFNKNVQKCQILELLYCIKIVLVDQIYLFKFLKHYLSTGAVLPQLYKYKFATYILYNPNFKVWTWWIISSSRSSLSFHIECSYFVFERWVLFSREELLFLM